MRKNSDILRFIDAQDSYYAGYEQALCEIRDGKKKSHWIWYIFPQFRALGRSSTAIYYGIEDCDEVKRYLDNHILNARIHEISEALLLHRDKTAVEILGDIDAKKVRSCMTMFDCLSPNDVFAKVLDAFYHGSRSSRTLKELRRTSASGNCIETNNIFRQLWSIICHITK